ncbi:NAD(P)-dependent oxidoreductase [Nesterenkonia haasae]|uniref:NAD(P)-dependent oxidoreductase n=1 Tax=Nesterenkonia haasae TaxID=2587813 RepID=UPI001391BBC6|nr:NAD(P)-dependent oxidoreductase [Nesterenkonia haasae]NDK31945.1 NAD(P)-dependent oxidoreductase [Nesterenkonia haasae]
MSEAKGVETIGFVGLGTMGGPMVTNLAASGYDVCVHDADPARTRTFAEELAAKTGQKITSAVEPSTLSSCSVVFTMLPTSAVVRSVLLTQDNELRIPFEKGTVIVDMSSSDPTETVDTGKVLAELGVQMVDAPVSGAKERAATGTLAIMLGADDDAAAERAIPIIEKMSRSIYRTGKLGTGHAMKALNNFVAAASFAAASEALTAGQRFGLDPATMVDVLNDSTGQSFATTYVLGPHIVEKRFSSGFALPLITKDVRIAAALQQAVGHYAPVSEAVSNQFNAALEALGPVDHTEAYRFWSTD